MPGKSINRKTTGNKNGRPRKKPRDLKAAAATEWWEYAWRGMTGQAVAMGGSTGKSISRPLSEQSQLKLWETIGRKLRPDLSAQAIRADVTTETTYKEPPKPRDLARAVVSILGAAKLAEQPTEPPPPPPERAQLLIGRDPVIELQATSVSAGQPATAAAPAGPLGGQPPPAGPGTPESASFSSNAAALSSEAKAFNPYTLNAKPPVGGGSASGGDGASVPSPDVLSPLRKPQHADKVEVDSNSSHIWFNGESKRWAVLDSDNVLHGWKRDRAEALAHAERLPCGAGPWQAHPFEPQDMGSGWHERRDNRATISNGKLNVVRRMPRGAR